MVKKRAAPKPKSRTMTKTTPAARTALSRVSGEAQLATGANGRRAETLLALITRRKARIAEDFYEIGRALKELFDKKLHVALGYGSFEELLAARDIMSATQARKLIQIVARVPLKTALELGPEKAFALIKYTDATPEPDTPAFLLDSGAKIKGKAVAEASLREIDKASKAQRKKAGSARRDANTVEALRAAKSGRAWLKARGIPKAKVEALRTKTGHAIQITLPLALATTLFALRE